MTNYREPRQWTVRSSDEFLTEEDLSAKAEALASETGLSPVTVRVCLLRGLSSAQAIQDHLFPKFESLHHPMSIRDMDRAVERLSRAEKNGEILRVFGDY